MINYDALPTVFLSSATCGTASLLVSSPAASIFLLCCSVITGLFGIITSVIGLIRIIKDSKEDGVITKQEKKKIAAAALNVVDKIADTQKNVSSAVNNDLSTKETNQGENNEQIR